MDAAVDQADRLEELLADGDVGADELARRLVGLEARRRRRTATGRSFAAEV
jgi:hypothetical protein